MAIKILIDNGHGSNTPGKYSPDKSLLEYSYTREIATRVVDKLRELGYDAERITPETTDISLKERVRRINQWCAKLGSKNCVSVSIHCNAAGADGKWHNASGWSVFVSPNASANSKKLAQLLYAQAEKNGLKGNRSVPKEKYWVQSLAMCRDTKCPAVLTENMFQDNEDDVKLLLSEDGKQRIVDVHVNGIIDYINSLKG
ncbi:MAG: N-acetylmuramoyl-L-alanine amidase [Lachnospiraceae bacterium]|nr:N-acetylmuramoyl-L-alanine amidase [Lachnospiraceae bacterium]